MAVKNKKKAKVVILIGAGSKLPAIIKAAAKPNTNFQISLVVSHKTTSPGIALALKNNIPAIYFKLPDYRNRLFKGKEKGRQSYMKHLGWFISQKEYAPDLLVFAGWDLIMDKYFFKFFKAKISNGYTAINLHPGLLPTKKEGQKVALPDNTTTHVIKGEQSEVLTEVLKSKVTYFGPTIHFMVANDFDKGEVIKREFIKVGKNETLNSLKNKLMPVEDKILIESIEKVCKKL